MSEAIDSGEDGGGGSGAGPGLSELQFDLMRVLWARGEASVAEVAEAVAQSRGLAHTTVATLLTRLAARGAVEARREGRQLVYRACISEPQVRRSMVSSLIQRLFSGDANGLLAHLVSEREVADGDLAKVQALLKQESRRG
jgi:BlaI family penicillinase repressor